MTFSIKTGLTNSACYNLLNISWKKCCGWNIHCVCVCECSCHGDYLVVEIGAVEGCGDCDWLSDTQDLLTVLEDAVGRRGREANQRDFRELPFQDAQQFIIYTHTDTGVSGQDSHVTCHTAPESQSPGLKSCPHWLQQCTSSTAMRLSSWAL